MDFNKTFTSKAEPFADKAYIEKTLLQLTSLPRPAREKLKPKVVKFLNSKNSFFSQTMFREIAGYVNDYQFYFEESCKKCHDCGKFITNDYCPHCEL